MEIELNSIKIRDLFEGYVNNDEEGVVAYSGKLNVRPAFQREFIYGNKERDAVIDTVTKGYPLNIMYWSQNEDDSYELLDGQQRTLSVLMYVNNDFAFNQKYFNNLTNDQQEKILNYEFTIYICRGSQSEKLEWFKVVNIAGKALNPQELRNSQYTGPWLYDAKKYFSKTACPAYNIGSKYLNGTPIRQDYLETVLKWISKRDGVEIEGYMAVHQHDNDANELWIYFQSVIDWVKRLFPTYRREVLAGIDWGFYYNSYKDQIYNSTTLDARVRSLILDEDVTNKKGICPYLFTGDEKYLSIRAFDEAQKSRAYERQNGICPICHEHFEFNEMEADHIIPWHDGGKTVDSNCQMLCKHDNRTKNGM